MKGKYLRHSFSGRLSLQISIVVGVVFLAVFTLIYKSSSRAIEAGAVSNAELMIKNTATEIEGVFTRVSVAADNVAAVAQKGDVPPDSLHELLYGMLRQTPGVMGCAFAFEPYYYPEKGEQFSPYVYYDVHDSTLVRTHLNRSDFSYTVREWYQIPRLLNKSCWSDPYYAAYSNSGIICSYSAVLRNPKGKFIGIMVVDMSVNWLNDMVQSIKPYPSSRSMLIGSGGTFIVCPERKRVFNESVFTMAKEDTLYASMTELGYNMVEGKSGTMTMSNRNGVDYVCYAPIPSLGWSVAMANSADDIFAGLNRNSLIVSVIIMIGLLVVFVSCIFIIRRIAAPLRLFANAAQVIARGDFGASLPVIRSRDEMRELYDSFLYMKRQLVSYINTLSTTAAAKEKIESELRIASDIQRSMIPKTFPAFPARNDLDIYAVLHPAKEVGGDLYDFFIDNNKLFFIIGDVSGKGVPASLFMAVTRSLFRSNSTYYKTPAEIVTSINTAMAENNEANMFVTLFVGVLDLETGDLQYCNAGHNPPYVLYDGTASEMDVTANIPVGLLDSFDYKGQSTTLPAGATLFCYTDGLTEAENRQKDQYGEERMKTLLKDVWALTSRQQTGRAVDDVAAFVDGADPSDDLTILTITTFHHHNEKVLQMKNDLSEIDGLLAGIEDFCTETNVPEELVMPLQLALEEAVANVIMYAYPDGEGEITLKMAECQGHLSFILSDSGTPYNPLKAADPDIEAPAEERPIGGLGVFIVKQTMDEVDYNLLDGHNVLTMKKNTRTQELRIKLSRSAFEVKRRKN